MVDIAVMLLLGCAGEAKLDIPEHSPKGTPTLGPKVPLDPTGDTDIPEDTAEPPTEWVLPDDPCAQCFHPQVFYPSAIFAFNETSGRAIGVYSSRGDPAVSALHFDFVSDNGDTCYVEFYWNAGGSAGDSGRNTGLSFVFEFPVATTGVIDNCSRNLNHDLWGPSLAANIRKTAWEIAAGGDLPTEFLSQIPGDKSWMFNAGFYYEGPTGEFLFSQGYSEGRELDENMELYWAGPGVLVYLPPEDTSPGLQNGLYLVSRSGLAFEEQFISAAKFLPENVNQ